MNQNTRHCKESSHAGKGGLDKKPMLVVVAYILRYQKRAYSSSWFEPCNNCFLPNRNAEKKRLRAHLKDGDAADTGLNA